MPETRIAILEDDSELEYVVKDNPPRGGMKYTYFTPDKKFAVQFFNDPADANSPIMRDRLEKIVGRYNPTLSADKGGAPGNSEQAAEYFSKLFCWPVHLIKSPEFGIVCPTYRLTGMLSPTGNLVPVGKAIQLQSGNIFKSCNNPNALLVEVVQ